MINTIRTITAICVTAIAIVSCAPSAKVKTSAPDKRARPEPSAPLEVMKSTTADRRDVEVTVYNSNLGLVKELRDFSVPEGVGILQFVDVPSQINPVTVLIKPLANADEFTVLEQNYEYDLISHEKLMEKYIGKTIKIIVPNEYHDRHDVIKAEVLSSSGARVMWTDDGYGNPVGVVAGAKSLGGEVYRIGDEIFLGHPGIKVLPELPNNLISRPTLSWVYSNRAAREYPLEVSYQTGGMTWSADYILAMDAGEPAKSGLSGWVTVDNQSGAGFEDAKLKLVAGEVNRAPREEFEANDMMAAPAMARMEMDAVPTFEQSELFEYYMYDLQRPTTIRNNQTKQISLMDAQGVSVVKEYVTSPPNANHYDIGRLDAPIKQSVAAYLVFKNTAENGLGNPLPAGIIRIYAADAGGSRQFVGEDRIAHTPRDEEIRLKAGEAFDIVAERTQSDFKQRTASMYETEWTVSVRNRKNEDITIGLLESAYGNWQIIESSHEHTKVNATTFRFDVPVRKGREVVVKYKIRIGM